MPNRPLLPLGSPNNLVSSASSGSGYPLNSRSPTARVTKRVWLNRRNSNSRRTSRAGCWTRLAARDCWGVVLGVWGRGPRWGFVGGKGQNWGKRWRSGEGEVVEKAKQDITKHILLTCVCVCVGMCVCVCQEVSR